MCLDWGDGDCSRALLGGWLRELRSYRWGQEANGSCPVVEEVGRRKLGAPWLLMEAAGAHGVLAPLQTTMHVVNASSPSNATRPGGVNLLLPMENGSVLVGGDLELLGNLARLSFEDKGALGKGPGASVVARPFVEPLESGKLPHLCWSDNGSGDTVQLPAAFATFCCLYDSMCPYFGMSVPCRTSGGHYCRPDFSGPECCPEGFFCSSPGNQTLCLKGSYCPKVRLARHEA
jgi:hypothetical protein